MRRTKTNTDDEANCRIAVIMVARSQLNAAHNLFEGYSCFRKW